MEESLAMHFLFIFTNRTVVVREAKQSKFHGRPFRHAEVQHWGRTGTGTLFRSAPWTTKRVQRPQNLHTKLAKFPISPRQAATGEATATHTYTQPHIHANALLLPGSLFRAELLPFHLRQYFFAFSRGAAGGGARPVRPVDQTSSALERARVPLALGYTSGPVSHTGTPYFTQFPPIAHSRTRLSFLPS